ncbi:MAG: hypothetical protein LBS84_00500 [Clostridiales bacterium]|nr:hypothetical protein [Clostridiales bacterium]
MIASLIIIGLSVLIIAVVLILYIFSHGKYRDMIKPLNGKDYAFFFMLPAGLRVMDMIKYTYSNGDRKLRESFSELYGEKYALFYLRIHIANKISTAMVFLIIISLFALYTNLRSLNASLEERLVSMSGNIIFRPEFNPDTYKNGAADISVEAEIRSGGGKTAKSYDIKVPMQIPVDETCVDLTVKDLEENFIKANKRIFENGISAGLDFRGYASPLGCGIVLKTESEQAYISESGELTQPEPEVTEPPVLRVSLLVSKGEVIKQTSSFSVKILPAAVEVNPIDALDETVRQINSNNSDAINSASIEMPALIEDSEVSWSESEVSADNFQYIIFIGGLFVAALAFISMDSDVEKHIKKRRELIKRDFPEFISKYVLLLSCGLTTYDSFKKILEDNHNTAKTFDGRPIYAELETAVREIDLGKAEVYAYEDFGLRCRIPETMKFSSLVIQNLRRGTDDLLVLLKEQVSDVWQLHKAEIRRRGEEAGTKLVFPMILSLVSVLLLVIYPVFASMNF